ncbi:MAG: CopG family transcriptional regulator [Sporichthyaceae bacterium]
MGRRKTTVYLDADLLVATKVLAATGGLSESQVVEDALRAYVRAGRMDAARVKLGDLMDRIATRGDQPSDDEAMTLAVEETRSVRSGRPAKSA